MQVAVSNRWVVVWWRQWLLLIIHGERNLRNTGGGGVGNGDGYSGGGVNLLTVPGLCVSIDSGACGIRGGSNGCKRCLNTSEQLVSWSSYFLHFFLSIFTQWLLVYIVYEFVCVFIPTTGKYFYKIHFSRFLCTYMYLHKIYINTSACVE